MGRWTFEGGNPLYIPDEGEGGGGMLGHLGSGIAQTLSGGVQAAGDALGAVAQAPGIRQGLTALGAPARAVVATGHALAPGGYKGTTDPIDYIMTGEKDDPEDLAGYGDLLADVMEAEGTINEQGLAAKAIRDVGNAIQDPLILFGAARGVAKMAGGGRPVPPSSATRVARSPGGAPPPGAVARQTHGGAPGAWTPGTPGTPGGPNTVIRGSLRDADKKVMRGMREIAEDAPTRGGGGVAGGPGSPRQLTAGRPQLPAGPKAPGRTRYRHPPVDPEDAARFPSAPLDTDLASPGAFTTGGTKNLPRARKNVQPLDQDLAYGSGRTRGLPKTGTQKKLDRATGQMKREQLGEGVQAMRAEQGPMSLPMPRDALRAMIQAAVENGASADDVMKLMSNLGG